MEQLRYIGIISSAIHSREIFDISFIQETEPESKGRVRLNPTFGG